MQRLRTTRTLAHNPVFVARRGFAAIWVIACIPLVIAAISFVVSIGRLNLARTELKTAAESAALGGARAWGQTGDGTANDAAGQPLGLAQANAMIMANSVLGVTPTVVTIELGMYVAGVFTPSTSVPAAAQRAFRVTLETTVTGKFGTSNYTVKSQALAVFNGSRAVITYDALNPSAS
jgi:uncharacterized membrane protein